MTAQEVLNALVEHPMFAGQGSIPKANVRFVLATYAAWTSEEKSWRGNESIRDEL